MRLESRMETSRNLTDDQKSQLRVLTVRQGDISGTVTQAEKDAASRAYSTVIDVMHGKPTWLDTPGGIQTYAEEQYKVEMSGFIKGELSLNKPKFNLKTFFTGVATPEIIETGNLVQEGRVEEAAKRVSATAAEFKKNFFDELKTEWVKKYPKASEPQNLDSDKYPTEKRISGGDKYYIGKRPLAEFYVQSEGKIYQRWMNAKGKMETYSIPEALYQANALTGDKWKKE
jgi:hypothetical protein